MHPCPFKWTPKDEAMLEELLIKHAFDFEFTAKAFNKAVNVDKNAKEFYQLTAG